MLASVLSFDLLAPRDKITDMLIPTLLTQP
jgi:hypothetical protein